jgi:hypothetical protein
LNTPVNLPEEAAPVPSGSRLEPDILTPGNHLNLRVGPEILRGTVDMVTADQSCFWIWTDGGTGRRMIDARDAALLTPDL